MKCVTKRSIGVITLGILFLSLAQSQGWAKRRPSQSPETAEANNVAPQTGILQGRPMTYAQAQEVIKTSFSRAISWEWHWNKFGGPRDIYTVNKNGVKFEPEAITWSYDKTSSDSGMERKFPNDYGVGKARIRLIRPCTYAAGYSKEYHSYWAYCNEKSTCGPPFSTQQDAQTFADALNWLHAYITGEAGWQDFQQKAAAWRALPSKPPIPEDVRRHRLLAEHALQEKQFDEAFQEYEAGLELYPVWPEGHYNAALVSAELKGFHIATRHMQAYLELLPDAPDAQAVRDQMIIWEDEIKKAH